VRKDVAAAARKGYKIKHTRRPWSEGRKRPILARACRRTIFVDPAQAEEQRDETVSQERPISDNPDSPRARENIEAEQAQNIEEVLDANQLIEDQDEAVDVDPGLDVEQIPEILGDDQEESTLIM
jgi:hypothetical protein